MGRNKKAELSRTAPVLVNDRMHSPQSHVRNDQPACPNYSTHSTKSKEKGE